MGSHLKILTFVVLPLIVAEVIAMVMVSNCNGNGYALEEPDGFQLTSFEKIRNYSLQSVNNKTTQK